MDGKAGLREKVILGVLALLLIGGGVWRHGHFSSNQPEIVQAGFVEQADSGHSEPELITVHLVGAVINPGIYHLPAGSRVYELIALCGGLSEEADRDFLNQARPIFDGEQIYIQKIGEAPVNRTAAGASAKININQATASELTALPGIGEVRAGQIIAYRDQHGYFKDTREIMSVSGIGEKTFDQIADLISIY